MANDNSLAAPVPNLPLLRKVLDFVDEHPEEHNQTRWGFEYQWDNGALQEHNVQAGKCGTAMCVAGWAMFLGAPEKFDKSWLPWHAAELLGLTPDEGGRLFYAMTRSEIQSAAESIAERGGERL